MFATICHKMTHAVRWQRNSEWAGLLIDEMVFEGMVTYFEIQASKGHNFQLDYFAKTMYDTSDEENIRILNILRDELFHPAVNYNGIFFGGIKERNLPRWSGYSAGYHIVKKYIERTGELIGVAFVEPYKASQDFTEGLLPD